MKLPPFRLESYFVKHEFSAPYLLCCSDAEPLSLAELLTYADSESRQLWQSLSLGYTEARGFPLLREAIADQYVSVDVSGVLPFAGAEEGIFCTFAALLSPGDHVVVVTPCYESLIAVPRALGARVSELRLDHEKKWELDVDQLESALRPDTRMLVLNYPHHPTGALLHPDQMERIVELARQRGAILFCDEVYRFLEQDVRIRLKPVADLYERAVSLHVLSKAYGLPGVRIGWIATQDSELLEEIANVRLYTTICNSAPSEILALMALRAKEALFARVGVIVKNNYSLLQSFFQHHDELFDCVPNRGSCTVFPKLLIPDTAESFCEKLLHETGVLLLPGGCYDLEGEYVRFGFGRKNMPEALERLDAFLTSNQVIYAGRKKCT